jgi:plastocyanin
MTWRARTAAAVLLLVAIGGMACGGSYDSNGPSGPPLTSTVIVSFTSFQPVVDTVKVGGTITWDWSTGSIDHNILSVGNPSFTSYGDSLGTIYDDPASYQLVFATAGSYNYFCSVHGTATTGMKARIDVLP